MTKAAQGVLVVGQSGGPTAVINATLAGVLREARRQRCFSAVYGLHHGIEGALNGTFYDLTAVADTTLERLIVTPGSALGSSRQNVEEAGYRRILDVFRAHNVRYFALIGGNGSMHVCSRLNEFARSQGYELHVIGVPKTIDNDLMMTDHTPGYGSAARFIALSVRDTGRDAQAMATYDDVTIMETLGRDTGWLAAASVLGRDADDHAPHLVYVPEVPFDEARFVDDVTRVHRRLGYVFVVVGEGLRDKDGHFIGQARTDGDNIDAIGRTVYSLTSGVAAHLTARVRERLGLQARFLRPGLIGRVSSACVAPVDREEALRAGERAARMLAEGRSGSMVTLERHADDPYRCEPGHAPLGAVAGKVRKLPQKFIHDDGNMVTRAFVDYARPLAGGALPELARLDTFRISANRL